jgi:hypothetical protein
VRPTQRQVAGVLGLVLLTCVLITIVRPLSIVGYFYYLALWTVFFAVVDRREIGRLMCAYTVTGLMAACYIVIQSNACPESYGTTTPGGSQTDDSYFFSLMADTIPDGLPTRPGFEQSSSGYSDIVKHLTPFRIEHPLDVVFFMSGVAGLASVYTRRFAILLTRDQRIGSKAFWLCLFCPLMLMNGGAVLVRDTLVAGLFMFSLCSLYRRKYLLLLLCTLLQFYLRPGTALILLVLHGFLLAPDILNLVRTAKLSFPLAACAVFGVLGLVGLWILQDKLLALLAANNISLLQLRRDGLDEYISAGGSGAFAVIQQSPFLLRAPLSAAFMWFVPFFYPTGILEPVGWDTRAFLLGLVYPIWILPVHACVFALIVSRVRVDLLGLIGAFACACFLIGMISLESRHKTVIQPLYYVLAAAGWCTASFRAKLIGYSIAGSGLAAQIAYFFVR